MAEQNPLVQVEDLKVWFPIRKGIIPRPVGHVKAVDGISFSIGQKEVLGVAGESGSGKTTIGRAILRLIEPTSGAVKFGGENIIDLPSETLRRFRRRAQIVFQDPYASLNPKMTVGNIIAEPLRVQKLVKDGYELKDRIVELLDMVSMSADYIDRYPHELSGGQRQRVGIARALAVDPEFIVADEPVSALDVSIQAQIINLLEELKERLNLSIMFISHDLAVMEYLSDRIAVVYLGKIMEIGPAAAICSAAKHPYTQALLSAVPSIEKSERGKRIILDGDVADPVNPPSGCVFRTRCPYAIGDCATAIPAARAVDPQHMVACIRDDLFQ